MKSKIQYRVVPNIPPTLETLRSLAYNVYFSWKEEIQDIFSRIDHRLWLACNQNPVLLLGLVSQKRLNELANDPAFLAQLEQVRRDFHRYLSQPRVQSHEHSPDVPMKVAYFSAEFGLARSLPIYSGGLGILSGDHIKSASDLNVPLVGVGLLYQEGYFSQYLTSDGWQMETYPDNDFDNMPVQLLRNREGRPLTVEVKFKSQPVKVQVWRIDVGRIPLYMLDTNVEDNPDDVQRTTAQLYGGDREMRLRQEIVLGVGGVRALRALGIEPTVYHMNEGHSVFSALERINSYRQEKGLTFDEAREIILASTVFTTHTPVPAGNEAFETDLVRAYFEPYTQELGVNLRVLFGYGRLDPRDDKEPFGLTPLALRLSAHSNGVSRLHGKVSRAMWQKIWSHHPVEDVPIEHITNGIHVPTWISRDMGSLFDRYLGPEWAEDPDNEHVWERVEEIPNTELWRTHERQRERLVGFTRRQLAEQLQNRGASPEAVQMASEVLTPDVLTIGIARRFATYKRATLLFRDPDRLERILNNPDRPVQIIIAGKAHPQDNEGKEFIKQIIHLSREPRFRRRIVFIEDYNLYLAQYLVAGADIWLNTPRRPMEACGTSGMKALANASLNISILDGWWDEGYAPAYGWAIGHGETYADAEAQDRIESQEILNLLEEEIVPLFYQRGHDHLPREWTEKMKAGLRHLVPIFNSHRMVQEYVNQYYVPCSKRFNALKQGDFSGARELAAWRRKLMTGWQGVQVEQVVSGDGQELNVGQEVLAQAKVRLGSLTPDDVTVEAYFGRLQPTGDFAERETVSLKVAEAKDGLYLYQGSIPTSMPGRFGYTVRITPSREKLENPFIIDLVTWA
jgi:starch phosphorylase